MMQVLLNVSPPSGPPADAPQVLLPLQPGQVHVHTVVTMS